MRDSTLKECPYPVTIAIYGALRWYMDHDSRYAEQWSVAELNALFRAFFWRNSLSARYDQGFLSQSSTDIRVLKEILFRRAQAASANAWATDANSALESLLKMPVPEADRLRKLLLDAKPAGALGRALTLLVRTKPTNDLLDPTVSLAFPSDKPVELHHIYPQSWCANNQHGELGKVLDPNKAEFEFAKSVANLTPPHPRATMPGKRRFRVKRSQTGKSVTRSRSRD